MKTEDENNEYKIQLENRLTSLEERYDAIAQDIGEIKNQLSNHITDLNKQLQEIRDAINRRPTWFTTGLVSALLMLLGVLIGIILSIVGLQ